MSIGSGRHMAWKLIFFLKETRPNQRFSIAVQLTHPFRGNFFVFDNPEAFAISDFKIGIERQMVLTQDIPAVVLHGQELQLYVGVPGQRFVIDVVNISADKQPIPFRAELHGKVLVESEDKTPLATSYQGPVTEPVNLRQRGLR